MVHFSLREEGGIRGQIFTTAWCPVSTPGPECFASSYLILMFAQVTSFGISHIFKSDIITSVLSTPYNNIYCMPIICKMFECVDFRDNSHLHTKSFCIVFWLMQLQLLIRQKRWHLGILEIVTGTFHCFLGIYRPNNYSFYYVSRK